MEQSNESDLTSDIIRVTYAGGFVLSTLSRQPGGGQFGFQARNACFINE